MWVAGGAIGGCWLVSILGSVVATALALRRMQPTKQAAAYANSNAVTRSAQAPCEFAAAACQLERRDIAVVAPGDLDQLIAAQRKHFRIEFLQTPFGIAKTQQGRDFVMGQHRLPRQ
jgi:alpha/beta superfamily hydrolase